jgi:hypothetical protein
VSRSAKSLGFLVNAETSMHEPTEIPRLSQDSPGSLSTGFGVSTSRATAVSQLLGAETRRLEFPGATLAALRGVSLFERSTLPRWWVCRVSPP